MKDYFIGLTLFCAINGFWQAMVTHIDSDKVGIRFFKYINLGLGLLSFTGFIYLLFMKGIQL